MKKILRGISIFTSIILVLGCLPAMAEKAPDSEKSAYVYIVRLTEEPVATYAGGIGNYKATRPTGGRLNVHSPESTAYRGYLKSRQDALIADLQKNVRAPLSVLYRYEVVLNGIAVKLTRREAEKAKRMPGVADVQKDTIRKALTNMSPRFIGCDGVWNGTGTGGLPGTKGEGMIVGVIDSGIWPEHPSFADDGSYPPPPARWKGGCQPPDDGSPGYSCNNKLIGINHFLNSYVEANGGYRGLFNSGRDDNGHGTHTASTAAGNENVPASVHGIPRGLVSGMAPRAHVASYKGLGPAGGYTSDLVACIEKAVADGVDVINYSIGRISASDPWANVDSMAYLNARAAGGRRYAISTSDTDPMCDTGFGGYVNLEDYGIDADSRFSGDSMTFTAFSGAPINFYGIEKTTGLNLTDDGFGFFDSTPGLEPWQNANIPCPEAPNDMVAIFWRNLEIVYDAVANRGVSLATADGSTTLIAEYDDIEPYPAGSTADRFDFEIVMNRNVSDLPGYYEIVYAYDNLVGDVGAGTVGVEDIDGTKGS